MVPEEEIELRLSCVDLPVQCGLGVRLGVEALVDGSRFTQIGQTEVIRSNCDPDFITKVSVVSQLDYDQRLKIVLYRKEGEDQFIAWAEVETGLNALLMERGQVLLPMNNIDKTLFDPDDSPLLGIEADQPESSQNGTRIRYKACNLYSEGVATPAPYFTLSLIPQSLDEFPTLLYRSEVCWDTVNPKWDSFVIPTRYFTSLHPSTLMVSCYHFLNNQPEDYLIGRFTVTFYQMLNGSMGSKFMLHSPGRPKNDHVYMEVLELDSIPRIKTFTSLQKEGLKFHFTVAIDFTANNGNINDPSSLHYVHPHFPSVYGQALSEVASSLCQLDKLQRISLLGFGAKTPPKMEFQQVFSLTGDLNNSTVRGPLAVMDAYKRTAMSVLPYAPTDYAAVIHNVVKMAKAAAKTNMNLYFVLVILTNGCIKQYKDSLDQIVQSSELPISILFAAVGNSQYPIGAGDHSRISRFIDPTSKASDNRPLKRQNVCYTEVKQGKPFARSLLRDIPFHCTQFSQIKK